MNDELQDLKLRTKAFALRIIRMYCTLQKKDPVAQVLGKQVLRSGTSVGANYCEASRGRSRAEFASKVGDCLKEIEETSYWLELLVESGCVSPPKMASLLDESHQLNAILTTIAKRSKRPAKKSPPPPTLPGTQTVPPAPLAAQRLSTSLPPS